MKFNINPDLDLNRLSQEYAEDQRIRIDDFLPVDQAKSLSRILAEFKHYRHAFVHNGKFGEASETELQALTSSDRQTFYNDIMKQAANGVGFWYGRHQLSSSTEGELGALFQWLNTEILLNQISIITAVSHFKSAIAQATRFTRGDFLTRHEDIVTKEKRKVAFVLNLPPQWHPDWGGLLQFFEQNGKPREAWNPDFNSLSLFDVSHIHSVTSISAFAPVPRLAISGWFQLK